MPPYSDFKTPDKTAHLDSQCCSLCGSRRLPRSVVTNNAAGLSASYCLSVLSFIISLLQYVYIFLLQMWMTEDKNDLFQNKKHSLKSFLALPVCRQPPNIRSYPVVANTLHSVKKAQR